MSRPSLFTTDTTQKSNVPNFNLNKETPKIQLNSTEKTKDIISDIAILYNNNDVVKSELDRILVKCINKDNILDCVFDKNDEKNIEDTLKIISYFISNDGKKQLIDVITNNCKTSSNDKLICKFKL